MNWVYS